MTPNSTSLNLYKWLNDAPLLSRDIGCEPR